MKSKSFSLFLKDYHSELRTRYAINSLAMFIIVAISIIMFAVGQEKVSESLTGGLFWVVIFFTAMSGLSRAFVSEEERGTSLTLQLLSAPSTVFSGKLIFNIILVFCMNTIIALFRACHFFYDYCCNYRKSWCKGHVISGTLISNIIAFDSYICSINFVCARWHKY